MINTTNVDFSQKLTFKIDNFDKLITEEDVSNYLRNSKYNGILLTTSGIKAIKKGTYNNLKHKLLIAINKLKLAMNHNDYNTVFYLISHQPLIAKYDQLFSQDDLVVAAGRNCASIFKNSISKTEDRFLFHLASNNCELFFTVILDSLDIDKITRNQIIDCYLIFISNNYYLLDKTNTLTPLPMKLIMKKVINRLDLNYFALDGNYLLKRYNLSVDELKSTVEYIKRRYNDD